MAHQIREMRRSFPDAEVRCHEPLVDDMDCDPKDRHVLSAAVRGNAEVLITFNTRDFPQESASACDITIVHPDDFLPGLLDLHPGDVMPALRTQAHGYKNPEMGVEDLLGRLAAAASRGSPPRQDDTCKTRHGG